MSLHQNWNRTPHITPDHLSSGYNPAQDYLQMRSNQEQHEKYYPNTGAVYRQA